MFFSIEIKPLPIALAICVSLILLIILLKKAYNTFLDKVDNLVLIHSERIAALDLINREFSFHKLQGKITFVKHYDNKSNYLRVEPSSVMNAGLRKNIAYYLDYIKQIKENKLQYTNYLNKVNHITSPPIFLDRDKFKIPGSLLQSREDMLFSNRILCPAVDCSCYVELHYRSAKGQVNLQKQQLFTLRDIEVCLESVSRSRLDKETYSQLASAERADVSDSLRYDIMNRDGFRCVICGAAASQGARLHIDHIVPIAKGGTSVPSNLRTLCERCNIGKSDKFEKKTNYTEAIIPQKRESICPQCGGKLVSRIGKYGKFLGCSSYPKCKYTRSCDK